MSAVFDIQEPVYFDLIPLTASEMRQTEQGISLFIRQPSNAPRHLIQLLRTLNASIGRIKELESRIEELESKPKVRSQVAKNKTSPTDDI